MKINSLFLIVFICVIGNCFGYKLRRDITKIRQYCKEICTQCGGEAALSRDVCVCNIEQAEGEDVRQCLERAKTKFDYLGIKLETDNRPPNKRSVYKVHHPGSYIYMEPDQEKKMLFKRSSGVHDSVNKNHKTEDKLRPKRSYSNQFDLTRFADIFQPTENYPVRPKTNFKILFDASKKPQLDRGLHYDMMAERSNDEDVSEDESDSSDNSDYSSQRAEFDLRRLEDEGIDLYGWVPPPNFAPLDESTVNEFNSIWDSVVDDLLDQSYYVPTDFPNDFMLLG